MRIRSTRLRYPESLRRTKKDFKVQHVRGSGPGGQHRNKVATGVRITDLITGLSAVSTDSRSQTDNKAEAFRKLARLLIEHYEMGSTPERRVGAGFGDRIRTYHEPRGTVVDHRTGERRSYAAVLDGDIAGLGVGVDSLADPESS
jgi:protein subunit release factor A